jgi:hypothetical protein
MKFSFSGTKKSPEIIWDETGARHFRSSDPDMGRRRKNISAIFSSLRDPALTGVHQEQSIFVRSAG